MPEQGDTWEEQEDMRSERQGVGLRFRPCRFLQATNLRILGLTLNEMGSHWRTLRTVNYPDLRF